MNEGYEDLNNLLLLEKDQIFILIIKDILIYHSVPDHIYIRHNPIVFQKSIKNVQKFGQTSQRKNKYAVQLSKTLKKIFPKYEKFVFCNSGTEAVMKSLRIARLLQKKKNTIISITGSWHGSTSELLYTNNDKFEVVELSSGLDLNFKRN